MLNRRTLLRSGGAIAATAATAATVGAAAPALGRRRGTGGSTPWQDLRAAFQGDVVLPSDAAYAHAKQVEIAAFDSVNPQAVAYAQSAADVRTAIRFAQDNSIPMRTRSGGHNFAGWSTGEGLVLDVSRFNQVTTDGTTVHLGPGAQAIDALTTLAPLGKQVVAGTCPTVCPGGFLSGGGIGFQSRTFGIGSDHLVSARVALADGRVVRASQSHNPDLFWALRGGGGGNFGVVLDFEVTPIAAPRMVYYQLTYAWDHAQDFLTAWQLWAAGAPNNRSSEVIVVLPDAAPGAAPVILLMGGYYGPKADLDAALADLAGQVGAQPTSSKVLDLPYDEAMKYVYNCNEITTQQCHRVGSSPEATLARAGWQRLRSRLVDTPIGAAGVNDVLAAFDANRRTGATRYLSFTGLGGVANEPSPTDTAYVHREAEFQVGFGIAIKDANPSAEDQAAAVDWANRGFAILDPLSSGQSYINFPDPALTDWQQSYYGQNYDRLVQVKNHYDPDHFFRHPRSIGN